MDSLQPVGIPPSGSSFAFDDFEIDPENRIVFRAGHPVPLTGKVFDTLLAFVRNPGRLLSKNELLDTVWGEEFVEEGSLARNVSTLRKALGDIDAEHRYILTVQGYGYRFVANVREISAIRSNKNKGNAEYGLSSTGAQPDSTLAASGGRPSKRKLLITESGTVYMQVEPPAKARDNRALYIFLLASAAVAFGAVAVKLWFFW